jgi:hypothetical protein
MTQMPRQVDQRRIEVVDEHVAELLRRKTPAERVKMISDAHRTMRLLIEGGLRTRHPDWGDEEILAEVQRRMMRGAS